ncbi:hypothetical protein MXB_2363, partial [Myxobolus squamalis]
LFSNDTNFNFSHTIQFSSQSTIFFSLYHQFSPESSRLVGHVSVTAQILILDFLNSSTTKKKRLDMIPVNSNYSKSYYCNMVVEFSCFVSPGFSEPSYFI